MGKRTEGEGPNPSGLCWCGCGKTAPLAKSSNARSGNVKSKPLRYLHGHYQQQQDPLDQYRIENRGFETACHAWTGSVNSHLGYGTYAARYAHILTWEKANGPVPRGHEIHHRCEQRDCIRLDHLECLPAGLHRKRHVKIDAALWDEIRAATGTTRQVAARYAVSKSHVWMIRSDKQPRPLQ